MRRRRATRRWTSSARSSGTTARRQRSKTSTAERSQSRRRRRDRSTSAGHGRERAAAQCSGSAPSSTQGSFAARPPGGPPQQALTLEGTVCQTPLPQRSDLQSDDPATNEVKKSPHPTTVPPIHGHPLCAPRHAPDSPEAGPALGRGGEGLLPPAARRSPRPGASHDDVADDLNISAAVVVVVPARRSRLHRRQRRRGGDAAGRRTSCTSRGPTRS